MTDAVDELRIAQRRHRRRMLVVLGAAALATGVFVVLLVTCTGGGRLLPPISKPQLYEVSGGGAPQPSYLFGTMHVAYSVGDLPRAVLAAQDRAATTVLESDLEARPDPTGAPAAPTVPVAGTSRRERLDDAEWAKLAKMTGISEHELETESTSHLLGAALSSMLPRVEAMDRGLQRRAREQGKELAFLETRTLEEVMADEPASEPVGETSTEEGPILDGLRDAIQHRGAFRAELLKMARSYATGDERACGGNLETLTSDLNDAWFTAIEAHARRGGAFIAIGCGHLRGDRSIIAQLEARGFAVTRAK